MSLQSKNVCGINIDELPPAPVKQLAECSRRVAAAGAVLLKNEREVLPLKDGAKIALFGRAQFEYIKSGTGSGGRVNTEYEVGIRDALEKSGRVKINAYLSDIYKAYIKDHPFDGGHGWATEPWSQEEMPLPYEVAEKAAEESDTAIVILSRLCGESRDNSPDEGGYLLQKTEYEMLKTVRKYFKKVAVLLNVGNTIDCGWIDELNIDSVLFVWQGGQEGGNAVLDLLMGDETPSGKLADTIAKNLNDFPCSKDFGHEKECFYTEDIYVGYRYFETFSKDRVLYPFGFGLSYTTFHIDYKASVYDNTVSLIAEIENAGKYKGSEVIELYYEAPQGKLGKPLKQLCGFQKTPVLEPQEKCKISLTVQLDDLASYDDSGVTGHRSCYVLESGTYKFFAGTDVRSAKLVAEYEQSELLVAYALEEALAPTKAFKRIKPRIEDGVAVVDYEDVPTRTVDLKARIEERMPKELPLTGDRGIKLCDVKYGKASMEDFVAQLEPKLLADLAMGEGMCSTKVKSGCGGAIGGLSKKLEHFGIPAACVTDGPSGLRFDTGEKATLMPNGTLIACTWDLELAEELFTYSGMECYCYGVDTLLGPGINIHRSPLNGRNFEYFSEDPLLTGKMATAIEKGMQHCNVSGTIKHFACNSQELNRNSNDSVVSERALREIYLRAFEIPVRSGYTKAIMTSYNCINGTHSGSNYDLNTTVLRKEWDYDGIVMTDWWPNLNDDQGPESHENKAAMVRAGNELNMVTACAEVHNDNILERLSSGALSLSELQRNAMHILEYLMDSNSLERYLKHGSSLSGGANFGMFEKKDSLKVTDTVRNVRANELINFNFDRALPFLAKITARSGCLPEVQIPITLIVHECIGPITVAMAHGSNGETFEVFAEGKTNGGDNCFKLVFNPDEIEILGIELLQ